MKTKLAAVLSGMALLGACNQGPPPIGIKDLMAKQVQPTADVYWKSVQYISDETGNHEILPRTDAEWERTRKAAEDLQALGQLLMTEPYTQDRNDDWKTFAQGLVDVSKKAEQAAIDKNVDAVFEVGGTVYSVCTACHQTYPPPVPADTPSNGGNA